MMAGDLIVFYIISIITILAAFNVVRAQRIMYSVLSLTLALMGVAGIFVTLGAEFLAAIQVLVYAGGVVILLLFAIMLTKSHEQFKRPRGVHTMPRIFAGSVFVISLFFYITRVDWRTSIGDMVLSRGSVTGTVEEIGRQIFLLSDATGYGFVIPFELISLVLLASMIGAIFLAKKEASP